MHSQQPLFCHAIFTVSPVLLQERFSQFVYKSCFSIQRLRFTNKSCFLFTDFDALLKLLQFIYKNCNSLYISAMVFLGQTFGMSLNILGTEKVQFITSMSRSLLDTVIFILGNWAKACNHSAELWLDLLP